MQVLYPYIPHSTMDNSTTPAMTLTVSQDRKRWTIGPVGRPTLPGEYTHTFPAGWTEEGIRRWAILHRIVLR